MTDRTTLTVERHVRFAGYEALYGVERKIFVNDKMMERKAVSIIIPNQRPITTAVMCTYEPLIEGLESILERILKSFVETKKTNIVDAHDRMLLYSVMDKVCSHNMFHDRKDKKQSAVEFFLSEYEIEIEKKEITLSILRTIDLKLSDILRQPRNYTPDLASKLPKGRSRAGRVMKQLTFDRSSLDPNDERDKLVLRALRQRDHAREGMRRLRQARYTK